MGLKQNKMPNFMRLKSQPFPISNDDMRLAMKETKEGDEYKHINTYASAEKFVVVKVLKNDLLNKLRLYLICEETDKIKNAIISFDKMCNDFISDDNGLITLDAEFIIKDIDMNIHIPLTRFEINLIKLKPKYISKNEENRFEVFVNKNKQKINMNFHYEHNKAIKAFVVFDDDFSKFIKLDIGISQSIIFNLPIKNTALIKIILIED